MATEFSLAEKRLLLALPRDGSPLPLAEAAKRAGFVQEVEAMGASGGPQRHGLLEIKEEADVLQVLLPEGLRYQKAGLPERRAVKHIQSRGGRMAVSDLADGSGLQRDEVQVAVGWLMKKKWARMDKSGAAPTIVLTAGVPSPGPDEELLARLGPDPALVPPGPGLDLLLERPTVLHQRITARRNLRLTPAGRKFVASLDPVALSGASEVNQVTPDLIARWPTLTAAEKAKLHLRPFDFNVPVAPRFPGKPHPLKQMIAEVREIFTSLGFEEISGDYVESAFWNMDALFIPQDHPARDMQDTFYLTEPATLAVPKAFWSKVRDVQQKGGGTGSTGWGGSFTEAESARALLRTHTTVTTIRHLAEHPKPPLKVFGVGRVFRKEAMDATHLPEFHQVEGILAEEGATLGTLIGILGEFYRRLGFPEVKFRPSYYPYTEPSLDVAVKWGERWLELGGAGIFRPEVTKPLGVPCNVLAWGLGLERLAMLRLGLKDIRQLYLSDVQWLRENPLQ
ncbi:MAG TPA: phenylalanine--tRNA ligase subunit alpha [Candidatus Thermoplasmatota archaeon]|nr:phenylalanine--tRNA ligase subunit alpha [Candidatus Thermoplasmatota archaeon]